MKNVFTLLIFLSLLSACGSDDCTISDYEGSYTGTITCDGEEPESITATVTAGSGNTIVVDANQEVFMIEVDGCDLVIPAETVDIFGIETMVSGSGELDGNTMRITQRVSAFGFTPNCQIVLNK